MRAFRSVKGAGIPIRSARPEVMAAEARPGTGESLRTPRAHGTVFALRREQDAGRTGVCGLLEDEGCA